MKATYPIGSGRPLFDLPVGKAFDLFTQRLVPIQPPSPSAGADRKEAA